MGSVKKVDYARGWNAKCDAVRRSPWLSSTAVQYYCAASGTICAIMFVLGYVAADFIAPIKPYWDAEQTADHYQKHKIRTRAGAAILLISGLFYMPFAAVISYQMRRIPNVHYILHQLQIGSAAAGVWTFILPGVILAAVSYRPDRPAEITYMFSDFFWCCAFMPWPTFMTQNFAFAYAIFMDERKKPLFPRELALVNVVVPCLFTSATGIHCVTRGPVAFNGAMAFWVPGVTFTIQLFVDSWYLIVSIREESKELAMTQNGGTEKDIEAGARTNGTDTP